MIRFVTAIIVDAYTKTEREENLDITKDNMQVFQRVWEATAIKYKYKSTHWIERAHIKRFLMDVGAFKGSAAPAVAKGARSRSVAFVKQALTRGGLGCGRQRIQPHRAESVSEST